MAIAIGDRQADRIVPPTGHGRALTVAVAAAMAFLCVFALALTLAAIRAAGDWSQSLNGVTTIRISAQADRLDALEADVMRILDQTSGIARARSIGAAEQAELLEPWLGPDLPMDTLRLPRLIELIDGNPPYDRDGLRLRLAVDVPEAVLDDHERWRDRTVGTARRMRSVGLLSIGLMAGILAGMITMAANASLNANLEIIRVLRLVGSQDGYVVRAFARRATLRTGIGAMVGTGLGIGGLLLLPGADGTGAVGPSLSPAGAEWLLFLLVPLVSGLVAFVASRHAAFRVLDRFE